MYINMICHKDAHISITQPRKKRVRINRLNLLRNFKESKDGIVYEKLGTKEIEKNYYCSLEILKKKAKME